MHNETLMTVQSLGNLLTQLGRHDEALGCYVKEFWGDVENCGLENNFTFESFQRVTECYDFLGHTSDSVALSRTFIQKIEERHGNDSPAISRVQEFMLGRSQGLSHSNNGSDDGGPLHDITSDDQHVAIEDFLEEEAWNAA